MSEHDALLTAAVVLASVALSALLIYAEILLDRAAAWARGRLDQWKERRGE